MKKLLFAICSASLLFGGCKEHDALIDFGAAAISDTTYVVTPPTALPHNVLVEEFSGQSCANCPAAHADLDAISASNPGRINVVTLYISGSPQTNPPTGSVHDLRDSIALILSGSALYGGISSWPSAGIDRTVNAGSLLQIGNSSWDGIITARLGAIDSVNLSVASTFDSATNTATISAVVTYAQAVSTPQNLSIVVVEDSIYDKQEESVGPSTTIIDSFLYLDVFRGMVTSVPTGDVLQVTAGNNAKEAGRLFQKVYAYTLPAKTPAIVPSHCRVIAFVNNENGSDIHVMQSAQCPLK